MWSEFFRIISAVLPSCCHRLELPVKLRLWLRALGRTSGQAAIEVETPLEAFFLNFCLLHLLKSLQKGLYWGVPRILISLLVHHILFKQIR